jgi:hypothetical protein
MNKNKMLIKMYLDYWNNFITVDKFATNYGLSTLKAHWVITTGRSLYNQSIGSKIV